MNVSLDVFYLRGNNVDIYKMLPQRAYKQTIIGGNLLKNIYSKTKNVVLNMLNKIPDPIKTEIKN